MKLPLIIFLTTLCCAGLAQNSVPAKVDSTNFRKLNPYALRGDMKSVFDMLQKADETALTQKQRDKKKILYERFLYRNEDFDHNTDDPVIVDLYNRFQNYWRSVIIEDVRLSLADSLFRDEMSHFLQRHFKPELSIDEISSNTYGLFQRFFRSKGLYGLGIGKTGLLYDLYLWKTQEEVKYNIDLPEGKKIEVPIVFMRDFISNGWSHYTTVGHSFSGGWATREKLFCVEESYGPKDEEAFVVSYISHEGQHFADFKQFPKLKQPDLEYRAKLTELVLAKTSTTNILNKFITNAQNDPTYAHGFANHTVIKLLSQRLLKTDFETDSEQWAQVPVKRINKEALKLLKEHTKKLNELGADTVEAYITEL